MLSLKDEMKFENRVRNKVWRVEHKDKQTLDFTQTCTGFYLYKYPFYRVILFFIPTPVLFFRVEMLTPHQDYPMR